MEDAVGQLELDIANLRTLITDLRPAALDELGIEAAIRALGDRLARSGIAVDAHVDLAYEQGRSRERHLPDLETAVYRIAQEALTNAIKHGHAEHAAIELSEDDSIITVVVRDDGSGFDPLAQTSGFGLMGMRERAELLEGTIDVQSAPGGPTTVTATFPVRRRPPSEQHVEPGNVPRSAAG